MTRSTAPLETIERFILAAQAKNFNTNSEPRTLTPSACLVSIPTSKALCCGAGRKHFVGVEDGVGVVDLLDLAHQSKHLPTLRPPPSSVPPHLAQRIPRQGRPD
eukprot:2687362-Rhodomonas_salina.2